MAGRLTEAGPASVNSGPLPGLAARVARPPRSGRAARYYRLGLACARGTTVLRDERRSARYLARAARLGSTEAAYLSGMAYLAGVGVRQDYGEASDWFLIAAASRHPDATYQVAKLYLKGLGVPQDPAWGALLMARAAATDHPSAMLELAFCHQFGTGVPVDRSLAWFWAARATKAGDPQAIGACRMLREFCCARERGEATRRALGSRTVDFATSVYVQTRLAQLGYRPGNSDGVWGPRSARALTAFRSDQSLHCVGRPTETDLEQLRLSMLL